MRKIFCCVVLLIIFIFCFFHMAKADELSELKDQMHKMQEVNIGLQEQLNRQREVMARLLNKIEVIENKEKIVFRDVELLKDKEIPDAGPLEEDIITLKERPFGPKLDIRGFADITFNAEDDVNDNEQNSNTFKIGQLTTFITSELSDTISVLAETVFEYDDENELVTDVERLELKYALSELVNIKIGRSHTALGFWNTEYHHSTWLHSTAFRPLIHNWEDEDGIIPNHFVGLYVFGKRDFDGFDFEYDLGIANGRGKTRTKIQNVQDRNDAKAFNARLQIAPSFLPELKIGVSAYFDKIPADTSTAARNGEIDELILGGHITYFKDNVELLAEVLHFNHDDEVSRKDYNTLGLYLQGAYQFDKWKPYYRFDFIDFGGGDPYFTPDDIDITKHTLGIRWDPITWNSIKLEYSYNERDDANDTHAVTIQFAFPF